jgi:hypothetical protein
MDNKIHSQKFRYNTPLQYKYAKNGRDRINNAMVILDNIFSKICYKNVPNFSENEQNNVVSLLDRMPKKGIKKES